MIPKPKLPLISRLRFRGANLEAITEKSQECILCAPADTGKTYALCYKAIVIATQISNVHGALVRKVYGSMQDSVVRTFDKVASGLGIRKFGGTKVERYLFKNGSEIVLVGLDKPDKLLSSEWDFIQVCQSEELKEGEWEMAASRATGRGANFRHPQIFGDCNPSNSKHWIRSRKSLKLITGSQKDNPELYHDNGDITAEGKRRMDLADQMLTGVRRQRLLYGIWATAEGAVYEMFNPQDHCRVFPLNRFKEICLTVDEGFTNPAVILAVGEDSDGRMHIFREFYQTQQLQETVVKEVVKWSREFGNPLVACDEAAAGLIADLKAAGLRVQGAKGRTVESTGKHIVLDGILAVQNRLKIQADGVARLTVDPSCVNTINEFESYAWKPEKDEPIKQFDHSMDALRYLVALRMTVSGFASAAGFLVGGSDGEDILETDRLEPEDF